MGKKITGILVIVVIVAVIILHNKRMSERECVERRFVQGVMLSRCASGLATAKSAIVAYAAEWNIWSDNMKALGLTGLEDKYYGVEILLADEGGFLASCAGNLDKDERLDIWVASDKGLHFVNLSDDCFEKGKIDDMGGWREEAIKIYEEAPGKSQ